MAQRRPVPDRKRILTLHDWEARHWILAAIIIILAVGMFAYSWS